MVIHLVPHGQALLQELAAALAVHLDMPMKPFRDIDPAAIPASHRLDGIRTGERFNILADRSLGYLEGFGQIMNGIIPSVI